MKDTEKFKINKEMLDLEENVEGIDVCTIFIPTDSLAEKLIYFKPIKTPKWGSSINHGKSQI